MKRIRPIFILSLIVAVICSCTEKLYPEGQYHLDEGELTECSLGISVGNFQITSGSGSRAEVTTTATDAEKKINDIWVFQYDSDGKLLIKPRYYLWKDNVVKKDDFKSQWPVVLKNSASTIYVVANTGSSTWAENYQDFSTLDQLKAQTLPSAEPIQVGDGTSMVKADDVILPMSGFKEVSEIANVEVPVQRMYAKLVISAKMLASMKLESIDVSNILKTCRVRSRSYGDKDTDANREEDESIYPTDMQTAVIPYNTSGDATTLSTESDVEYATTAKDYIIYVPENIRGENKDVGVQTQKGRDYDKNGALCIVYTLQVPKSNNNTNTSYIESKAKVYPGENNYNNFNVKRNRIYNVVAEFPSIEYFYPTPSSNCFVVKPESSVTFWPYVREEVGGGYNISTYINPGDDSKTIKGVKIIWQDKDAIGDNSDKNNPLVTLETPTTIPDTETDKTAYIRKNTTITVKTNKVGNALIGAYNNADCTGDVLWSWHIWVTDIEPNNVGNAIRYTTYSWDNNGINTATRIPGYQVMPCNLGATALVNTSSGKKASGLLYQWGRKDPFPPMLQGFFRTHYTNDNAGIHYGNANTSEVVYKTSYDDDSYLFHTHLGKDLTNAIGYSVAHPTVFIAGTNDLSLSTAEGAPTGNYNYYFNGGDWCPDGQSDNKLWGGHEPDDAMNHITVNNVTIYDNYGSDKTIFDPCPTGWRVPPGDLWLGFTSTGMNPKSLDEINCKYINGKQDYNAGMYIYLEGWKTGTPSYFPTPGLRVGDGLGMRNGKCGNYHNASTGKDNKVNILHIHADDYILFNIFENRYVSYHVKSDAGPIRCVRDKK